MLWLIYALVTAFCWGLYGVMLHIGQTNMGDPLLGRYKSFLFVGLAYFIIAIVGPTILIWMNGGKFEFTMKGFSWSFLAGVVGAIGAFFVLLAFGAKGTPGVVMSIIFGGAPLINAVVAIALHPPAGGLGQIKWQFYAGIILLACGGVMVTFFKPAPSVKNNQNHVEAKVGHDK